MPELLPALAALLAVTFEVTHGSAALFVYAAGGAAAGALAGFVGAMTVREAPRV